jgi:hypothetical protein
MNTIEKITAELNSVKNYYTSDDFIDEYTQWLLEDLDGAVDRLVAISQREWDIIEDLPLTLDRPMALAIIEYVRENINEYVDDFRMNYVGYDCVDSISFGEQEHCLDNKIDKKVVKENGNWINDFYIEDDGEYAYYDMSSSGVCIKITQLECYEILQTLGKLY